MIDLRQFQIEVIADPHGKDNSSHHQCQQSSHDHSPTTNSFSQIHEPKIKELEDQFSSIEHSVNFLDHLHHTEHDLSFSDKMLQVGVDQEEEKTRKKLQRRIKNETKNIPKNYGKGVISFIERNEVSLEPLLDRFNITYNELMGLLKEEKKKINTIADLRRLWTDGRIGKILRIISNLFFRKHSLHYIFNSRISNFSSHIKYRQSLWMAIRKPEAFNHIKQF